MKTQANIVVLAEGDNVGVAVQPIGPGEFARSATGQSVAAAEEIPLGHKIALRPIATGEKIVRFGVPVGIATADIAAGHAGPRPQCEEPVPRQRRGPL